MQLLLPLFSEDTQMITPNLGVCLDGHGFVFYLHSGVPIYCHHEDNLKSFQYITSQLIDNGVCSQSDIVKSFFVSTDSVRRALKLFQEHGAEGFFGGDNRKGTAYRLTDPVLEKAQKLMDSGMSNNAIAKKLKMTEGAIRYAIKQGKLKKKEPPLR